MINSFSAAFVLGGSISIRDSGALSLSVNGSSQVGQETKDEGYGLEDVMTFPSLLLLLISIGLMCPLLFHV